jgi:cytochrome c-type biogenesis protein CcmH/NrfF
MKFLVAACLACAMAVTTPAAAAPEDVANDIASKVVSPYCPGVTLHDCPSAAAVELRTKIQSWIEDGVSKQAVLDRLEQEYGTTINAAPAPDGTGIWAYVLPAVALIGGLALLVFLTRRWTKKGDGAPPSPPLTRDERARLESELSAFRSGS